MAAEAVDFLDTHGVEACLFLRRLEGTAWRWQRLSLQYYADDILLGGKVDPVFKRNIK